MRMRRAWILGGLAGALLAAAPAAGDPLEPAAPGVVADEGGTQPAGSATPSRNPAVQAAARALRRDPLYIAPSGVDPKVALGAEDQQAIRAQLASLRPPLFVAVLPAIGEPTAVLDQVARATGRDGTYLVVTGRTLRAQSNVLPAGAIAEITRDAFDAHHDQGLAAVLRQSFDALRATTSGGLISTSEPDADDGAPTVVLAIAGGTAALFALVMLLIRRKARRMRRQGPDTGPAFWSSGAYRSLGRRQGTTSDSTWITGAAAASTFDSSSSSSSDSSSSSSSDSGGGSFDSGSSGDSGGSF